MKRLLVCLILAALQLACAALAAPSVKDMVVVNLRGVGLAAGEAQHIRQTRGQCAAGQRGDELGALRRHIHLLRIPGPGRREPAQRRGAVDAVPGPERPVEGGLSHIVDANGTLYIGGCYGPDPIAISAHYEHFNGEESGWVAYDAATGTMLATRKD